MNRKISNIGIVMPVLFVCMSVACNIDWKFLVLPNIAFAFLILYKRKSIMFGYSTIALLCMLVSGIISMCTTLGDKQDAVHELVMVLAFILSFFCGKMINSKKTVKIILSLGFFIAVAGILAYCNIIKINEFVFNDRGLTRLQSFMKYANTTALFLGCSYYAVLDEIQQNDSVCLRNLGGCILLAMFLTVSKAEIPLFLLIGTVLCLLTKKNIRLFVIQNFLCAVFAVMMLMLVKQNRNSIAFMLAALCIFLAGKINFKNIENDMILSCVWISMLVLGVIGSIFLSNLFDYDIWATFFKRLEYINDAVKLLKNHWITGIGTGAWRVCQYQAQSTEYAVNYLHNGWLQFWLENGIVFIVSFVWLFVVGLFNTIKQKQYTLSAILILIMIHSFVDINFSFGIILITLGLLLGNVVEDTKISIPMRGICYIVVLISLFFNLYLGYEIVLRSCFEKAYLNKQYDKAHSYVQRLERICPYDSMLKVSAASLDSDSAKNNLEKAITLSPYDKDIFRNYISYLIANNYSDMSYKDLFDKYITLAPKQEKTYIDIKTLAKTACEKNLCSLQEYDEIISNTEKRRKEEHVIDRNELLNKLTGRKD